MRIMPIREDDTKEIQNNPSFKSFWIYREAGRITTLKEVDKCLNKIVIRSTIEEKLDTVKNFIKSIFKK